jgi:hypothetical protein
MSEPIADGVPTLPPVQQLDDRLDVEATAGAATDLDPRPAAAPGESTGAQPVGRHGTPEPLTRAQRRAQVEAQAQAESASLLDHPAVLVALSVLTLVAVVVGLDLASQGTVVALLPAVLLVGAYVVVVRRRLARR